MTCATPAPRLQAPIPLDFRPVTPEELEACLSDPMWRVCSGALYKIMIKGDDDDDDNALVIPFRPNRAQRKLLRRLWNRNIILKARQLGFTTLICVMFLDACLFGQENTRAGIIAHTDDVARGLFRDKVKFAYDNLPDDLRMSMPLGRDSADELLFAHNNASIRVSTSMRSGTLQYLHVSEFGKICARFPQRADEVVTGSIPAVSPSGIIFIESTAEGRDGHFYTMTKRSEDNYNARKKLSTKEYRFHFFPWWDAPEYRVDPDGIIITTKEHAYFDTIEASQHCEIDIAQRAWWVSTRDNEFSGQEEMMWQEYPSTPAEAFQVSKQGCYYTVQMTAARKQGRITTVPLMPGYPVNSFWDIGSGDGCAVWLHQHVGTQHRFVRFFEGWGEPYGYFVKAMQDWASENNAVWGRHYLPHDGNHVRQGMDNNATPREMLEKLGLRNIEIVPRINELQQGIQLVRDTMGQCWLDEAGCKEGIDHLDMYRKRFNATTQTFTDEPLKDVHTEGADSFRQFAQALHGGMLNTAKRPTKKRSDSWRTA